MQARGRPLPRPASVPFPLNDPSPNTMPFLVPAQLPTQGCPQGLWGSKKSGDKAGPHFYTPIQACSCKWKQLIILIPLRHGVYNCARNFEEHLCELQSSSSSLEPLSQHSHFPLYGTVLLFRECCAFTIHQGFTKTREQYGGILQCIK